MNGSIKYAFVLETESVYRALETIENSHKNNGPTNIALVVNEREDLVGILTDGDIRALILKRVDLNDAVRLHMNANPITISRDYKLIRSERVLREKIKKNKLLNERNPKSLANLTRILVMEGKKVVEVLTPSEILLDKNVIYSRVCVVGLGYVGLTLAMVLAENGFQITGIDPGKLIGETIKQKKAPFFEQGLDQLIARHYNNNFTFLPNISEEKYDIYIVAVGTPVNDKKKPVMTDLIQALTEIGSALKFGDTVILRSTVPPQTCREIAIPLLEKRSKLKAGRDFNFVFAPERTVQGKAIQELKTLPQIIGGLTPECVNKGSQLFNIFSPTIIKVDSLESAEVVKLLNNSFRDVCFGYSNQVAILCEKLGIDTVSVINAANEGYVRNPIPLPSPGVGGSCLNKDPYIFIDAAKKHGIEMDILSAARNSNENMIDFILLKINEFLGANQLSKEIKIFILGIAFKGVPETSDIRDSTSIDTIHALNKEGFLNIYVFDPVVKQQVLENENLAVAKSVIDGFQDANIVLFMNNHHFFGQLDAVSHAMTMKKPGLFFDTWHFFQQNEIELVPKIKYQSLGTKIL